MPAMNLPGLSSGIDSASLIKQLMIINSRRLAKYQIKKQKAEAKNTLFDELRSKIRSLRSASKSLSNAQDLKSYNISVSDTDILSASTSSSASPGSHSIDINQLANSETWILDDPDSGFIHDTDYVISDTEYSGNGYFIYSYNYQEVTVTVIPNETTLEELATLINEDEDNPGVTASLMFQGGVYRLMLTGQESGEDYRISINSTNTETWQAETEFTKDSVNASGTTLIKDLDQFSGTMDGDESITINGTTHFGTELNRSYSITENTTVDHLISEINDLYDGAAHARLVNGKIYISDAISGTSEMTLSLSYSDPGASPTTFSLPTISQSVVGGSTEADVDTLSAGDFIITQTAQNSKTRVDGYPQSQSTREVQTLTPDEAATGGTYTLTYGGQTTTAIDWNATTAEIEAKLEELSNVEAGDIEVGGSPLTETSGLTFTFKASAGNVSMMDFDFSFLTGSPNPNPTQADSTMVETTAGKDEWIERNSNTVTDAITGISLNLRDVTEADTPVKVTVNRNTGAVSGKISGLVASYNELADFLATNTEYNPETKTLGKLSSDIPIVMLKSLMRDPFREIAAGFYSQTDSFVRASDIGLTLDGNGRLEIDQDELTAAIDEDYTSVLSLVGAMKTGNSDSNIIDFYNASDKYTDAGEYTVKVTITDNAVTSAQIKLSSENDGQYRAATISGNVINGNSDFDSNGDGPVYPENSLQLTIDTSVANGEYTATVRVKQGFAGNLEDWLDGLLKLDGTIDLSEDTTEDSVTNLEKTISREESRLESVEARLVLKYARLEKTLALLQQQYQSVSILSSMS